MKKALEQVAAFNRMVGAPHGDVAKPDATVDMELRLRLIAEEFDELLEALAPSVLHTRPVMRAVKAWLQDLPLYRMDGYDAPPNLPEVADALADLAFVTIGANDVWGIPGDAVWEEVCRANMAKFGGPKDPKTGKALKPPGWAPPDIKGVLKREASKAERRRPHRRGDQVARFEVAPSHLQLPDQYRWVLDERADPEWEWSWWAYAIERHGALGRRAKIDISCAPGILEPWPREFMPGER